MNNTKAAMIALVALASIVGGFLYINRGRTIDEANVYVHEDYFGIEIRYSVMPRGRISTTAVEYEWKSMSGDELIITAADRQVNWNGKPLGIVGESEFLLIEMKSGQYKIMILLRVDDQGQE